MSLPVKNKSPQNVLFIPSGSIGDALMMLALCVEIQKYAPDTRFTIVARRNSKLIGDMAANYSFLKILPIEKNARGIIRLLYESFRRPYAAFMPGTFGPGKVLNTAVLFRLLRLRPGTHTYGLLKQEGDANSYNVAFAYRANMPHMDNMRRLARAAGFTVEPDGAPIEFTFKSRLPDNFPFAPDSYLVYHPFASSSWKSFPPSRSRELLRKLAEKYPQLSFVITGGHENAAEAQQIIKDVPRTIIATGLPILEAAGIIAGAAAYIGVDTGTLHVASVLRQKVIALEHNASPEWLPTYNPNAVILTTKERCTCDAQDGSCVVEVDGLPYMRCLYEITDEQIMETVHKQLHG